MRGLNPGTVSEPSSPTPSTAGVPLLSVEGAEEALTDLPAVDGACIKAPVVLAPQHPHQGLPQAALQQGHLLPCWLCHAQHLWWQEWPSVVRAFQLGSSIDVDELQL